MKSTGGRGLRRTQTIVVCVALAWGLVCAVAWALPSPAPKRPSADVALTDDDGELPLFPIPALKPGEAVSRCITLQYAGEASAEVRMLIMGSIPPAALPEIAIQVETGTGGRFGDCTGFLGTAIYQGTLGGLAEMGQDWSSALALMRPASSQSTTLRITAGIDDSAQQGVDARTSFAFTARSTSERVSTDPGNLVPVPVPTKTDKPPAPKDSPGDPGLPPTPGMTQTPPAAPTPSSPGSSSAATDDASTLGRRGTGGGTPPPASTGSVGTTAPTPEPSPSQITRSGDDSLVTVPGFTGRVGGPNKPRSKAKALSAAVSKQLAKIGKVVTQAAETVLVRSPFPLALALLVFGFLGLQNRIDRRDPKLALAPVFGDPDVAFGDPDPTFRPRPANPDSVASLKFRGESPDALV